MRSGPTSPSPLTTPTPTKAAIVLDEDSSRPDLLTTSRMELCSLLNGNKNSEICGSLASFD
ncbi:hypothetical protein CDL15_Pgr005140 [Punica granatum]|uniref:Uncharacterized protein n=1 Tax=Punica granatum TaxID=22663 RepID=A0A218WQS7_PUNGR|nr:hypothetical protein CDL15_Pgr005140 [Punica granatum]